MRRLRGFVVRRVVWMIVTAWLVLTLAFLTFVGTPDPNVPLVRFLAGVEAALGRGNVTAAQQEAAQQYAERHNYDVPILQRYIKWMTNYATLQWGETLSGKPVTAVLGRALTVTLTYLAPALLVSTTGAIAAGLYVATHRGGLADRLATTLAYAGYGVPIFFAGEMLFGILVHKYGMVGLAFNKKHGLYSAANIDQFLLPAVILTVHLFSIQLVLVRSEVIENLNADFMKTLTASGAGLRDLARHALRNAAIPLVSAFFAEILTLLYLGIIVLEVVFGLPGFGAVTIVAIKNRDIALILGVTFVPLLVGIVGNFLQDLAYTVLDPRIDYED